MVDSWSVPIATGAIGNNINDIIAKGPDLSWINNLADNYFKGKDQRYTQDQRDLFKNGIPSDPNQLASMLLKSGGSPQLQNYMGLQQLQLNRDFNQQVGKSDVFNPLGQPGSQPQQPQFPPSTAATLPNSQPNERLASSQPTNPADVPTGVPMPPGQNIGPGANVEYGPVETAGKNGFQSPPQLQPQGQGQQQTQPQPFQTAQASTAKPGMDEATAQMYDKRAADAARFATNPSASPQQAASLKAVSEQWAKNAQIIRGSLAKNSEVTPEQKNASASGAFTPLGFDAQKEDQKLDITNFDKENTALQNLGRASANGIHMATLGKALTLQDGFYSGPLSEMSKTYNQFKASFGSNPSSALPQEAIDKVANTMLIEQTKALGQSGVGRVLQSEFNAMRSTIASLGITPQTNRALLELSTRAYQQNQKIAQIAQQINETVPPGQRMAALNRAVSQAINKTPLFTEAEQQNPSLLGAPDVPAESVRWSPEQKRAWAGRVGLKPGDAIRFNGQIGAVP